MTLSVIIVNYNVKSYLEQCLYSVQKAATDIEIEIFVVDNNSLDGSVEMLKSSFPKVKIIANTDNKGFAAACNQGLELSTGKYALLLNPDTVVSDNSFSACIQFMEEHGEAGALGVRMINGNGQFLPESKRSLPTPLISFYKIFGLSALFPKSKIFGKYQLKYINENELAEVEVLSGAFMFLRMETLLRTGFLDERFFMYGEDIDLSYRITKSGYKNFYFPETTIIHYKGESTKKASLNYVRVFYKAMIIFAKKHYTNKNLGLFLFFIHLAIYFRASISIFKRLLQSSFLPLLDFVLIYLGFRQIIPLWANFRFGETDYYPPGFQNILIPSFIVIWLFFIFLNGGYKHSVKSKKLFYSILYGSVAVLITYSLLPETYRYSRTVLVLGIPIVTVGIFSIRMITSILKITNIDLISKLKPKTLVVYENTNNDNNLFEYLEKRYEIIGYVSKSPNGRSNYLGSISRLKEIVRFHKIAIVVYLLKDINTTDIINSMRGIDKKHIDFKIILQSDKNMADQFFMVNLAEYDKN